MVRQLYEHYLKAIEKGVYVNVIFNYTQNKEKWMNN